MLLEYFYDKKRRTTLQIMALGIPNRQSLNLDGTSLLPSIMDAQPLFLHPVRDAHN